MIHLIHVKIDSNNEHTDTQLHCVPLSFICACTCTGETVIIVYEVQYMYSQPVVSERLTPEKMISQQSESESQSATPTPTPFSFGLDLQDLFV